MLKSYEEEKRLFESFLDKYKEGYDYGMLDYILRYFYDSEGNHCDIVAEIRSFLKLDEYEKDRYMFYFDYLKSRFDLTGNILEVACGPFPTTSKYIDDYQTSMKKGTIEAYDPFLVTDTLGNIKLHKNKFNSDIQISDKTMAFSMAPCDYTLEFIKIMDLNNKPFSMLLCPCFDNNTYHNQDEYVSNIIMEVNKTKRENEIVEVLYLDNSYDYPTPIITKLVK